MRLRSREVRAGGDGSSMIGFCSDADPDEVQDPLENRFTGFDR